MIAEQTRIATQEGLRRFLRFEPRPPDGRSVVLAGVEGNQQIIGLPVVADATTGPDARSAVEAAALLVPSP